MFGEQVFDTLDDVDASQHLLLLHDVRHVLTFHPIILMSSLRHFFIVKES
jgi:hypothetical protein